MDTLCRGLVLRSSKGMILAVSHYLTNNSNSKTADGDGDLLTSNLCRVTKEVISFN